jgi:uncharacterized membrane protein HdeD (DUF308 family)
MRVFLIWIYYVIMCIGSYVTMLAGGFILFNPELVSENVARIPVGIFLFITGLLSAVRYMSIGFENSSYYRKHIKL